MWSDFLTCDQGFIPRQVDGIVQVSRDSDKSHFNQSELIYTRSNTALRANTVPEDPDFVVPAPFVYIYPDHDPQSFEVGLDYKCT